ncbi:MAG: GTP 3',8-cyclase MoaA [Desulfobacteraceae bacterium]|nr:GTP 3',8-cyclase MoaA [Desulfobacteraceae bacterium]
MIAGGNRSINYLRISVTDRCNFRCVYCIPSKPFQHIKHRQIARYEEILRVTRQAVALGITKVRITGGEPFVRKDIMSFLEDLCNLEGLKDISITTNGALLTPKKIEKLLELGITRLNFSLDTLNPDKFEKITCRQRFQKVWDAIMNAHTMGISPVKINSVILRGINDDEIVDIASLAMDYPFHIRFIEYMPMGNSAVEKSQQVLTSEIQEKIEAKLGQLIPVPREFNDGPAKKFKITNAKGVIGFITAISSHFCGDCNRLRLTSRGTLRPCLLNNYEKDILSPMRNGATDQDLKEIIETALAQKPLYHDLNNKDKSCIPISHMTSIGG